MSDKQKPPSEAQQQKSFRVVDDPSVKELYVNRLVSTSFDGGALSVTMGVARMLPEKTDSKVKNGGAADVHVTARLALSPSSAVELAQALSKMLQSLSKIAASRAEERASAESQATNA